MPNESQSFDIVVLGAGTGGYTAAFRAGQLGLKVALVDDGPAGIGGTCLHLGCIPTKAMLESADLYERIRHAGDFGISVGEPSVDAAVIGQRRERTVARLVKGLHGLIKKNGVTYVRGRGRLEGPQQVRVATVDESGEPAGEVILRAQDVILATGSRVKSLPGLVPDGQRIVTSDDVLRSTAIPASIIVVGAGAVGVEFASYYHDLGSEVTVLEYLPAIVPLEDAEISTEMERAFRRRGIKVMTSARFDTSSPGHGREGRPAHGRARKGRRPPSSAPSRCWWPPVARPTRTRSASRPRARSSTGASSRSMATCARPTRTCTPSATSSAGCGWPTWPRTRASPPCMPSPAGRWSRSTTSRCRRATYARPQIASIGLTSAQCEAAGRTTRVGKFPFTASGKAIINGDTGGFVKVIADAETDELLGVHMIGAHVTELIAEASVGMLLELTAWEVGSAVHPHPTLSEALGEAAMAVDGKSINF